MENKDKQAFLVQHIAGLTKREYFAALAMQGLISNETHMTELQFLRDKNLIDNKHNTLAKEAVIIADALLKQLEATE